MNQKNNIERIELRSEKMREVIGPIPRRLVWTSVAMLALLVIILIAALMLLPDSANPAGSLIKNLKRLS